MRIHNDKYSRRSAVRKYTQKLRPLSIMRIAVRIVNSYVRGVPTVVKDRRRQSLSMYEDPISSKVHISGLK